MARLFNDAASESLTASAAIVTGFPLTFACLARVDSLAVEQSFISLGDSASTHFIRLGFRGDVAGDPLEMFVRASSTNFRALSTAAPTIDTWCSAIGTVSAAGLVTVYLNGGNSASVSSATFPTLDRVSLGSLLRGTEVAFLSGMLAECAVWQRLLDAAEIAALASRVSPLSFPTGRVLYQDLIRDINRPGIGPALTASGTSVVDHPRVTYPSGPIIIGVPAAGDEGIEAAAAQSFPSFAQAATAQITIQAAATQSFPSLSQSATATPTIEAAAAQTFPSFAQAAAAETTLQAVAAQTFPAIGQSVTAAPIVDAAAAQSFPALTQSAAAAVGNAAAAAQTFPSFVQAAVATPIVAATAAQSFPSLSQSLAAETTIQAAAAQSFPSFGQSAVAAPIVQATAAQSFPALTQSAAAAPIVAAAALQTFPALGQSLTAAATIPATVSQAFPRLAQAITAAVDNAATVAQTFPSFGQSATADNVPAHWCVLARQAHTAGAEALELFAAGAAARQAHTAGAEALEIACDV